MVITIITEALPMTAVAAAVMVVVTINEDDKDISIIYFDYSSQLSSE